MLCDVPLVESRFYRRLTYVKVKIKHLILLI